MSSPALWDTHPEMRELADTPSGPIRLWPALFILAAAVVTALVPGQIWPRTMLHFISSFASPLLGTIALLLWWRLGACIRGRERWLLPLLLLVPAVLLIALQVAAGVPARDALLPVFLYQMPAVATLGILWLAATALLPHRYRIAGLILVLLAGWGVAGSARYEGTDGDMTPTFHWRWQPTAEDRFQVERAGRTANPAAVASDVRDQPGDWSEFRGPNRDSRLTGVAINPDWQAAPPKELWRCRVGPGWGSFAAVGDRLFTQEQRGTDEAVVCYAANTGEEVWEHRQPGRFSEAMGGVGPRGTPTIHDGKVYAQGATGKLLCLDAASGRQVWAADVTDKPGGKVPPWGFSSSPLVIQGVVIVFAAGPDGKGTAAFNAATGELAWAAGKAAHSYSSAQRATFGGVEQALMVSDHGIESFRPADGALLWEHAWPMGKGMNRVTQPAILNDTDLVMTTGVGNDQGLRRLRVTREGDKWDVKTVWSSRGIKPYYNDGVVYRGHLYGFDGARFCCVDLENGRQLWKDEGEYGHGQTLLLADQGVLLVQAVNGKIALLDASPDGPNERAKIDALKGKTWNHPVIAHGKLFVRNDQEAIAFQLAPK